MKFVAKVYEPFYDHNDKKYIRFVIPQKVSEIIETIAIDDFMTVIGVRN